MDVRAMLLYPTEEGGGHGHVGIYGKGNCEFRGLEVRLCWYLTNTAVNV